MKIDFVLAGLSPFFGMGSVQHEPALWRSPKHDFSASTPVKKKETKSHARMGFCQQLRHRYNAPRILAASCGLSSQGQKLHGSLRGKPTPAQAPPTDNLEVCSSAVHATSNASPSANKSWEERPNSETCFGGKGGKAKEALKQPFSHTRYGHSSGGWYVRMVKWICSGLCVFPAPGPSTSEPLKPQAEEDVEWKEVLMEAMRPRIREAGQTLQKKRLANVEVKGVHINHTLNSGPTTSRFSSKRRLWVESVAIAVGQRVSAGARRFGGLLFHTCWTCQAAGRSELLPVASEWPCIPVTAASGVRSPVRSKRRERRWGM